MKKMKRILSALLAVVLLLCVVPVMEASATSKSADQAIAWCQSKLGVGVGSGECVAFIQEYYEYLGVSRSYGNGADYTGNTLPSGWQRLQGAQPQKGDILVYTGGYGHVAIYESERVTYHQNFNSARYVQKITNIRYNGFTNAYWGVIRPNFSNNVNFGDPVNIGDVVVKNSDLGYVITCKTSSNATRVRFPSWTDPNGTDDIEWIEGDHPDNDYTYWWAWVGKYEHGNYEGYYHTHIYAYNSDGKETKYTPDMIYVGNLVKVWGISNQDNSETNIDVDSNPTISGTMKFWFKEYDLDDNYYLNVYIDDNRVLSYAGSDQAGYTSYVLDTRTLSNGQHAVKVELYDSSKMYTDIKYFKVSNPYYSLDLNGWLDGKGYGSIEYYGTADVYINGKQVANDVTDFYSANGTYAKGSTYEIKDIKAKAGHTYNGVKSGSLKGTLNANTTVVLNFTTNSSTLKVNPNGGTWNGSTATQTFKQNYNTTKAIPVPTRSGYKFTGWTRSGTYGKLSSTTVAATYTYGATNNVTDTITATWSCNHSTTTTQNAKAATCTDPGYTGDQVCTVCGNTITQGKTIAKLGHTDPDESGNCMRCGTHLKDVEQPQNEPTTQPQQQNSNACKFCGGTHSGPFGWLIQIIHNILAIFKR